MKPVIGVGGSKENYFKIYVSKDGERYELLKTINSGKFEDSIDITEHLDQNSMVYIKFELFVNSDRFTDSRLGKLQFIMK
ncbi:MAG: hypothetical protein ISS36_00490 [Candidatus Aenigmarchaeota archaeon]|nr:hypothetical protein [Candidatus Aenigmarchaeota archaeon]